MNYYKVSLVLKLSFKVFIKNENHNCAIHKYKLIIIIIFVIHIYSNGLLDPWSSGGVMHNISKTVQAVIIPESAHHLDLRASNPQDPESVIKARQYYKNWIKKWTTHYQKRSTRDPAVSHLEKPLIQLTI